PSSTRTASTVPASTRARCRNESTSGLLRRRSAGNPPPRHRPEVPTVRVVRRSMLPVMDITGASAIVTGGASGIGAAAARQLAARGAKVVIADLNADKGEALA